MEVGDASHYMVRVLHLASKHDNEMPLGRFIVNQLNAGRLPSLFDCQERFTDRDVDVPKLNVMQHELSQYNQLLQGGCHE